MSSHLWHAGRMKEAQTFGQNACAIAETLDDFPLKVAASYYLGTSLQATGDYRLAEGCFRKLAESLPGDLSRPRFGLAGSAGVMSRGWLVWALAERGKFDEGIAFGQEAVRIADLLDHPYSVAIARWRLAYVSSVRGEVGEAISLLEDALGLCKHWGIVVQLGPISGLLGYVYALAGRVAEGLPLLHEAKKQIESIRLASFHSLTVVQLGKACLLAKRFDEALAWAGQVLKLTRERGERSHEARTLRLLGEIASRRDPLEVAEAEGYYRQALALAEELGMRPLQAHCHLGLGQLYSKTGQREVARAELPTAIEMYRSMGMTFWLPQAEAALASLP
jgi:tetratricopeptide (TPR) repeat protein